ncbi:MAG: hypothetical protein AB7Q16_05945 [Vicinamibacterales bacterium]
MYLQLRQGVATLVLIALGATVGIGAQSAQALPPAVAAKVEAHRLRVENAQLRAALGALQAELDTLKLTVERTALEAELRAALKPPPGSMFDWQALTFTTPPPVPDSKEPHP